MKPRRPHLFTGLVRAILPRATANPCLIEMSSPLAAEEIRTTLVEYQESLLYYHQVAPRLALASLRTYFTVIGSTLQTALADEVILPGEHPGIAGLNSKQGHTSDAHHQRDPVPDLLR